MAQILVIDDEVLIRTSIQKSLKQNGYQVAVAPNGKVGMKLLQKRHFDLVITDLLMPEKEGIETIVALRRYFPETKIIAISGGGRCLKENNLLHTAQILGAHSTLSKPFGFEEILEVVRHELDRDGK